MIKGTVFRLTLMASLLICTSLPNAAQNKPARRAQSARVAIAVQFVRFISNAEHTYAQYKVTNRGTQAVRFPGSAVNANWLVVIKQGALIKQGPATWGTHLFGTYSLLPGTSIVYDVQLPDGDGTIQIGFGYESGPNHVWNIAWSEDIKTPARATGRD
jgi:hypothetical protein